MAQSYSGTILRSNRHNILTGLPLSLSMTSLRTAVMEMER